MPGVGDLFPIDAPGMPMPGADFIAAAQALGDKETEIQTGKKKTDVTLSAVGWQLESLIRQALYGRGGLTMSFTVKGTRKASFTVIAGHRWGRVGKEDPATTGPEPCDVMVISKMLTEDDVKDRRMMLGSSAKELVDTLRKLGVPGINNWYVTSLLKTLRLDDGGGQLRSGWLKNQLHLLHQEIRLVRPRYILMLGSDVVKVLCGKRMTLGKVEGRVLDLEFDMRKSGDDDAPPLKCLAMGCQHPAAILHQPEKQPHFEKALNRFGQLVAGVRWDQGEGDIDHRLIESEGQLRRLCKEIDQVTTNKVIAMDAEWQGDHPEDEGAYLRLVQLSWAEKKAAVLKLRHAGGKPAFRRYVRDEQGRVKRKLRDGKPVALTTTQGGIAGAMAILTEFMQDKRPCGHYFNADLEWLIPEGLDLRQQFAAPETWEEMPFKGGLDTALMAHALDETDDFTLTGQTLTYTSAPRYDVELSQWKESHCRERGIKVGDLEGYGNCPDDVLVPYAAYDADVTYRLAMRRMEQLDADRFGNNCWKPLWISSRAALPVLEITRTGLCVNKDRVDELTATYMEVKNELEATIREWARWPELNLSSVYQVRELLFGRKYNGKEPENGVRPRLRPKGARSVGALPLLTTEKRPRPWEEVMQSGKEDEVTPSTSKSVLGMMLHQAKNLPVMRGGELVHRNMYKVVKWIRDYRFISQVLKSVLRPPLIQEEDGVANYVLDDDDNMTYAKGIPGAMCADGRVRTTIYQTKETGRWSSARPPLQNIGKRREPDLANILGSRYSFPLRSILCAPPGWCLLEADYVGAELFIMAVLSGDDAMIDHALRNQLSEDDPNFYDIHSNVAVLSFGFDCPPTKAGLEQIGKKEMRIVAKSIVFGLAYGRGAKAIAVAAREEGIEITEAQAQQVIDTIFDMYPNLQPFFEECRMRAVNPRRSSRPMAPAPRWLQGVHGRYRRFPEVREEKQRGDFERQAMNFPMQNAVADHVSLAIAKLYDYREDLRAQGVSEDDFDFRICLQVHDAIMLMAPAKHIPALYDEIVPRCMVDDMPLFPAGLDGTLQNVQPYRLGIDTDVQQSWGVKMNPDECLNIDLDPKYAGWRQQGEGYTTSGKPDKIWIPKKGFVSVAA